jgi:hypothetical protein
MEKIHGKYSRKILEIVKNSAIETDKTNYFKFTLHSSKNTANKKTRQNIISKKAVK